MATPYRAPSYRQRGETRKRKAFKFHSEVIEQLDLMSHASGKSQANVIERVIRQAYRVADKEPGHPWGFKMTAPREWNQKRVLKNYRLAADVIGQLEHLAQIKHYSQAYTIEQLITDAYLAMSKGEKMPHLDINTAGPAN